MGSHKELILPGTKSLLWGTSVGPKVKWVALLVLAGCAILLFVNCGGQSHKMVSMNHKFGREQQVKVDLILGAV